MKGGQRPMITAKERIIFPLDVSSPEAAKKYIYHLSDHVGMFKVGLELFVKSGPEIIKRIQESGTTGIFLDLKLHDIPVTVLRAMQVIADLGVSLVTVHCGESEAMLRAAVDGAKGRVDVLGVTVLTSVNGRDIKNSGFKDDYSADISKLVLKRAAMAQSAGCQGVVCSALETQTIKTALGREFLAVTPGIRPESGISQEDDQQRVATPAKAIQNGSDYLVIGRPIRDANDPKRAAIEIAAEIESVSAGG